MAKAVKRISDSFQVAIFLSIKLIETENQVVNSQSLQRLETWNCSLCTGSEIGNKKKERVK